MKKILMIGTGGTIASKWTEDGLAPGLTSEDILSYIPQVKDVCEVSTLQVCNIDSTNVTPKHWVMLSKVIEEQYDKYDGFVICHGTDTLAYTAAALSYMIQNSNKPIVITGSQKPINMDVTDAKTNLLDSFIYAADEESQDVNIVFDGKVIVGTRAKKERAKSYNAFSSINFPYPAVIQDGRVIRYLQTVPYTGAVRFYHEMKNSVYVLKVIPGMNPDILGYIFDKYDAIVIESFGVGGLPESVMERFYQEMSAWISRGKIVVMTTQVANEGSNMTVYEVGKKVKQDFNLIEAYDMTLEATITKLMWLMGLPKMKYTKFKELYYTMVNHDILFTKKEKKKQWEYLFFDLDGTLTDPKEGITKSVAYALQRFGIETEDLDSLCKFIGPPLKESFQKYYGMNDEEGDRAVELYREYFRPYGVYENKVYEGIDNLLAGLKEKGKCLVVASSKPTVFVETVLEHFNLRKYFTVVVGSELDGRRVKKGEVIAYAMQEAGVTDESQVVMIGDREHDIIGAKENRIASIGVTYGYGSRKEHEAAGADRIAESVQDLAKLLG